MMRVRTVLVCLSWLVASMASAQTGTELVTTRTTLAPPDPVDYLRFGASVAVDGDVAAVGASQDGTVDAYAGAVYVFRRGAAGWVFEAKLLPAAPAFDAYVGASVSVSGDTIAAGGPSNGGVVDVWVRSAGSWSHQARLTSSLSGSVSSFGFSVDIDGDRLLVGDPEGWSCASCPPGTGSAYVFERSGGVWAEVARLVPSGATTGSGVGYDVALDGDRLVMSDREVAYVWDRVAGVWVESATLTRGSSTTVAGGIGLDADTAAFGAPASSAYGGGFAYIYEYGGGAWSRTESVSSSHRHGFSIDLSSTLLVSAASDRGLVWDRDPASTSAWRLVGELVHPTAAGWSYQWAADSTSDVLLFGSQFFSSTTHAGVGVVYLYEVDGLRDGTACTVASSCASGNCVDGVCCDSACGGGVAEDCMACSSAAGGAASDGTCGPLTASAAAATTCRSAAGPCDAAETCSPTSVGCPADMLLPVGTTCRASAGSCDVEETCSGTSVDCPADAVRSAGIECRPATGVCDVAESCDGTDTACPADGFASATTECRAAAGACDVAETCDGSSADCPADAVATAGLTCRAATGPCDAEEVCDGAAPTCPADGALADGTPCGDGVACNGDELCAAGVCEAAVPLDCDDANPCTADACEEPGGCTHAPVEACCRVDADCDDGDPCTIDTCSGDGGTCNHESVADCLDGGVGELTDGGLDHDGSVSGGDASSTDVDGGAAAVSAVDGGGCSCGVGESQPASPPILPLVLLVLGFRAWRRRASPSGAEGREP